MLCTLDICKADIDSNQMLLLFYLTIQVEQSLPKGKKAEDQQNYQGNKNLINKQTQRQYYNSLGSGKQTYSALETKSFSPGSDITD